MTSESNDAPKYRPPSAAGVDFGYAGAPPLEMRQDLVDMLVAHCLREQPIEACGIVAGVQPPRADSVYPLANRLASPTRYDADPGTLIAVIKCMRSKKEHMLAIYHSHPTSPAVPSQTDLRENYYGSMPRMIVSLERPRPAIRLWRLDESSYEELLLVVD